MSEKQPLRVVTKGKVTDLELVDFHVTDAIADAFYASDAIHALDQRGRVIELTQDPDGADVYATALTAAPFAPDFVVGYWSNGAGGEVPMVGAAPPVGGRMEGVDGRGYDNIVRHEPFSAIGHAGYGLIGIAAYGIRRRMDKDQHALIALFTDKYQVEPTLAITLCGALSDLSAQHLKLLEMDLSDGLTEAQLLGQMGVEQEIRELIAGMPGLEGVRFVNDVRGTTVGLQFQGGESNSLTGTYKVPIDSRTYKALDGRDFWSEHKYVPPSIPEQARSLDSRVIEVTQDINSLKQTYAEKGGVTSHIVLTIEETGNAAFIDGGRQFEIARILDTAAHTTSALCASVNAREQESAKPSALDGFKLFDLNGNKVGKIEVVDVKPTDDVPPGALRLVIDLDDGLSNEPDILERTARLFRLAASGIREGQYDFPLVLVGNDGSRHEYGSIVFSAPEAWQAHNRTALSSYLTRNCVRKADGGYGGIADGEYRYVVGAGDFEFGYGLDAGPVYLVNAKGEVADGYENGDKIVRETYTSDIPREERAALEQVANGALSFEEFERMYGEANDNEPEV